jgi:hypothetical protein
MAIATDGVVGTVLYRESEDEDFRPFLSLEAGDQFMPIAFTKDNQSGYAALAGIAFTPDLYAAAVDYVGVSNQFTLLETLPPYWESFRNMFYERVGHPEKDKELLGPCPLNQPPVLELHPNC